MGSLPFIVALQSRSVGMHGHQSIGIAKAPNHAAHAVCHPDELPILVVAIFGEKPSLFARSALRQSNFKYSPLRLAVHEVNDSPELVRYPDNSFKRIVFDSNPLAKGVGQPL